MSFFFTHATFFSQLGKGAALLFSCTLARTVVYLLKDQQIVESNYYHNVIVLNLLTVTPLLSEAAVFVHLLTQANISSTPVRKYPFCS